MTALFLELCCRYHDFIFFYNYQFYSEMVIASNVGLITFLHQVISKALLVVINVNGKILIGNILFQTSSKQIKILSHLAYRANGHKL